MGLGSEWRVLLRFAPTLSLFSFPSLSCLFPLFYPFSCCLIFEDELWYSVGITNKLAFPPNVILKRERNTSPPVFQKQASGGIRVVGPDPFVNCASLNNDSLTLVEIDNYRIQIR